MSVIFRYPAISPTSVLTLRSPELGDINRQNPRMVLNESRAGDQIISRPDNRPNQHSKSWEFTTLTLVERDQLIAFLNLSAADLINITDQNNRTYDALITSPTPVFATSRDECSYSVSLDLIVVKEDGSPTPSPSPSPSP